MTSFVHPKPYMQKLLKALTAVVEERQSAERKKNARANDAADHDAAA